MISEEKIRQLKVEAARIRITALLARERADSGHIGGSYSIADILSVLYFDRMNIRPEEPGWPDRDRFVLSKGHCTPTAYAALAHRGYLSKERLIREFRQAEYHMSGHMEMHDVPGVDMSTGSLGQGISAAVGMALAGRLDKKDYKVYCIVGDGEIEEGQVWEAAMAAGYYHLSNLIVFVDNNKLQLDGTLKEIMDPGPIDKKFEAFGFRAISCDGHDIASIEEAIDQALTPDDRPTVIVADTIKGKGVSVFENDNRFHGGDPTPEEYQQAYRELNAQLERLGASYE